MATKCMSCGGPMKRAKVGTIVNDNLTKREVRQAMRKENKMDRQDKRYMRQYEKQKAEELMKSKRFKTGGITQDIVGMPGYNARTDTMKKGGVAKIKTLKKAALGMNVEPTKTYLPGAGKKAADKVTMMNPKKYSSGGSSTAVKHGCPPGTARLANGGCGSRSLYGG